MSRPKDEFPDLQEAMDLWREDTEQVVHGIDVQGDLADHVVAEALRARASDHPSRAPSPAGVRAYAAAALLLIGIGVGGTLLARPSAATEIPASEWVVLQEELIEVLSQDPDYEPGLGR